MSRKLAPLLVVVLALSVAACEETTTQTETPTEKPVPVWKDKSKDELTRAEAYAEFVSGGETGPCPLAPGQVGKTGTKEETFACIYNAAFAGCFEAFRGNTFLAAEYRREYPEPLMFSSAKSAHKKCSSFR